MPEPSILVVGTIGFAAMLLAALFVRPGIVRSGEGKILALIACVAAPALAAYGGMAEHRERTRSTSYCVSCHAMGEHGKGLYAAGSTSLPAVHVQNRLVPPGQACYACHTDYGFSGSHRAKVRGMKHIVATYFGTVPDTIRMARRYRNRECFRCHLGARSFESAEAHQAGRFTLADMKNGKASCSRSGCHDVVHRAPPIAAVAVQNAVAGDPLLSMVEPAPSDSGARTAGAPEPTKASGTLAKEPTALAGPTAADPLPLVGPMPDPKAAAGAETVAKPTTKKTTKPALKPAKRRRTR
jgi:nitrate/TMAO reductase-like tetraheme cytochrome c subunit